MQRTSKKISNSRSTGGGGNNFERHVQAMFLLSMLVDGYAPILDYPVTELSFQTRPLSIETDDLMVIASCANKKEKLLCQIKSNISFTKKDKDFQDVISAAWNDYNSSVFNKETDKIALITDTVAKASLESVRTIHTQANSTVDANDFLMRINQSNCFSDKMREKLDTLKYCLTEAKGAELSDNELYGFCKVFSVVLFDGSYEKGIQKALCTSLIRCKSRENPRIVWDALTNYAGQCNENGAHINKSSVDVYIKELFDRQDTNGNAKTSVLIPSQKMACAFIIGSWDENNEADRETIETISGLPYYEFLQFARERIEAKDPLFSLTNGVWRISYRKKNWHQVKDSLYDDIIRRAFHACSQIILEESQKYTNRTGCVPIRPINGWFAHSDALRTSICQGLCLLSNNAAPKNSTAGLVKGEATRLVNNLFQKCTWRTLAGLGDLFPIIAEMSPHTFLQKLEEYSINKKTDLRMLFPKTSQTPFDSNDLMPIMWSLERLAWIPEYFIACVRCLGIMAAAGNQNANKENASFNSIVWILNAFKEQTYATIEQRENALKALKNDSPELCWRVIKALLPESSFSFCDSQKPMFIDISSIENDAPQNKPEELFCLYVNLAIQLAGGSAARLSELSAHTSFMSGQTFSEFMNTIIDSSSKWSDQEKYPVWDGLCSLKVRVVFDNNRTEPQTPLFSLLCKTISKTKPTDIWYQYLRLFTKQHEYLLSNDDHYEKLEKDQKAAILDIYTKRGIDSVISFGEQVKDLYDVGRKLGTVLSRLQIDEILGEYYQNVASKFYPAVIDGYIRHKGENELLEMRLERFDESFRSKVLLTAPFVPEVFSIVNRVLENKSLYWENVYVNLYASDWSETTIKTITEELENVERFDALINAIGPLVKKIPLPDSKLQYIMRGAINKGLLNTLDSHAVRCIIKKMQLAEKPDIDALAEIEYAFLPFLDKFSSTHPKALYYKLANDSNFFCSLMKRAYKPYHREEKTQHLSDGEAQRLFILVYDFCIVPGTDWNGLFVEEVFQGWLNRTLKWARETDREAVVQQTIGNGLSFAEKTDGLPNDVILRELNKLENKEMRRGYMLGVCNQRGAHFIDPEGKPEIALSEKYKEYANAAYDKGYSRIAETMMAISKDYLKEAETNKKEYEAYSRVEKVEI